MGWSRKGAKLAGGGLQPASALHPAPAPSFPAPSLTQIPPAPAPRPRALPAAEESARHHADGFVAAAHKLVGQIERLYEGVEMPRSDFSMSTLWK